MQRIHEEKAGCQTILFSIFDFDFRQIVSLKIIHHHIIIPAQEINSIHLIVYIKRNISPCIFRIAFRVCPDMPYFPDKLSRKAIEHI